MNMKKLIVTIVVFSILYFVLGYITVVFGWFPRDTYLTLSGIIGGLASVCGLLSFGISQKISKADFEDIEATYLKKVSETADTLREKNDELIDKAKKIDSTEQELRQLEIQKKEMEFLVMKASMSLFLKDQLKRNQNRMLELVENSPELKVLLDEMEPLAGRLALLDQEIELDPNVDMLIEVINRARSEKDIIVNFKPSFLGIGIDMKQLLRTLSKLLAN